MVTRVLTLLRSAEKFSEPFPPLSVTPLPLSKPPQAKNFECSLNLWPQSAYWKRGLGFVYLQLEPKCSKSRDLIAIAICDSNRESQITTDLRQWGAGAAPLHVEAPVNRFCAFRISGPVSATLAPCVCVCDIVRLPTVPVRVWSGLLSM